MTADFHLAQLNIGRLVAPVDSPLIADFVALLDPVNAIADALPGFVWRLQTDEGNATEERLTHLREHGPTPTAFTFKSDFPPPGP